LLMVISPLFLQFKGGYVTLADRIFGRVQKF
jgi:hypothetical protein